MKGVPTIRITCPAGLLYKMPVPLMLLTDLISRPGSTNNPMLAPGMPCTLIVEHEGRATHFNFIAPEPIEYNDREDYDLR